MPGPLTPSELAKVAFGSMLVRALSADAGAGDDGARVAARAALILAIVLVDSHDCQCRALVAPLEMATSSAAPAETLIARVLRLLDSVGAHGAAPGISGTTEGPQMLRLALLRLLFAWTDGCPSAVRAVMQPPATLPLLLALCECDPQQAEGVAGMAAALLASCLVHCAPSDEGVVARPVLEAVTARVGLSRLSSQIDDLRRSPQFARAVAPRKAMPPITRENADKAVSSEGGWSGDSVAETDDKLTTVCDASLVARVGSLADGLGQRVVALYSHSAATPAQGEGAAPSAAEAVHAAAASGGDALRAAAEAQAHELDRLRAQNAQLADQLLGGGNATGASGMTLTAEMDGLRESLHLAERVASEARDEATGLKCELEEARDGVSRAQADLQALSSAYNTLEAERDSEVGELRARISKLEAGQSEADPQARGASAAELAAAREEGATEARAEAEAAAAESEAEMNDLLACLGIEEEKVEQLSERLVELGEDPESLLEGIGGDEDPEDEDE